MTELTCAAQQKITDALLVLSHSGKRTAQEMRALICGLEAAMLLMPGHVTGDGNGLKTSHHFAPGVYMRELFIPKGTILTGKIHKTSHLNILSQGKLTVWTEDGMKTLQASAVIKSMPGIKRVGYALEDSIWITVHQNLEDEKDIEKLEKKLVVETFEEAYLDSSFNIDERELIETKVGG